MELELKDKVAIITGSARGIGAAPAAQLRADGLDAYCVIGDITKSDDVQRLVAETIGTFGGADILASERASFISGEVLHVTGGRYG